MSSVTSPFDLSEPEFTHWLGVYGYFGKRPDGIRTIYYFAFTGLDGDNPKILEISRMATEHMDYLKISADAYHQICDAVNQAKVAA